MENNFARAGGHVGTPAQLLLLCVSNTQSKWVSDEYYGWLGSCVEQPRINTWGQTGMGLRVGTVGLGFQIYRKWAPTRKKYLMKHVGENEVRGE